MTLYIGNISYDASDDSLRELLAQHGQVRRLQRRSDRNGKPGVAFAEMPDAEALAAMAALNGAEWCGRRLKVSEYERKVAVKA